jgi:TolB-like protein
MSIILVQSEGAMTRLNWVYLCVMMLATVAVAGPTTRPSIDVLVTPFKSISDPGEQEALGRAVQQNLMADLARGRFHPAQENDPAADPQSAGQSAGAQYVIAGNWQTSDQSLRFTAQIIEVKTGSIVGGLSATGASRDLFALEDTLSTQAIHQLRQLTAPSPAQPTSAVAATPPTVLQLVIADNPYALPYQGSDLEAYVNSNRKPSNDFWQQYRDSSARQTYNYGYANSYYPNYGFGYGGFGYGGFGYGFSFLGNNAFLGRHVPLR